MIDARRALCPEIRLGWTVLFQTSRAQDDHSEGTEGFMRPFRCTASPAFSLALVTTQSRSMPVRISFQDGC
ncbi:hypothetical protein BBK82_34790 [Lentzea guizhouensis]|uniref:Uncharacterized protein n=1 Tax=Lentzea guizhouensis TaxID=1586287 RepID=A0A1B2HRP7_9PSEU|nr:hypothetical protein BBK82_34790 [Lentzea guizhouensis]